MLIYLTEIKYAIANKIAILVSLCAKYDINNKTINLTMTLLYNKPPALLIFVNNNEQYSIKIITIEKLT